ncbi:MAG: hypothetical protein ACOVO2_11265 [Emticicia sp.]|uniref:hypothetical protein n=1 Tax=Emticicia sp. TaxID=1930953 RepID=UPI003BA4EEAA
MKESIAPPRSPKFIPPTAPKPTSGKCRVGTRNDVISPINPHGFIEFTEPLIFNIGTTKDLLFYIDKKTKTPNAYFSQTPQQIVVYVFYSSVLPVPDATIAQLEAVINNNITPTELERNMYVYLESEITPTKIRNRVIDKGTTTVRQGLFAGKKFLKITYPIVEFSKDFGYNKDIWHFTASCEIFESVNRNEFNGLPAMSQQTIQFLQTDCFECQPDAYPIHQPTNKPSNQLASNIIDSFELPAYNTRGKIGNPKYGNLLLGLSNHTPRNQNNELLHDSVYFKYKGCPILFVFHYHLVKMDYNGNYFSPLAPAGCYHPMVLRTNFSIVPDIVQESLDEEFDGGGDPKSIPYP